MINESDRKIVIRTRAIIFYDNKLLVVKHSPGATFYSLPGGHLEWSEDVRESLKREIVEELGIEPQIGRLLYIHNFIQEEKIHSIEFFFEVTNSVDYLNIENLSGTHRHEIAEIRWVDKNDSLTILPTSIQIDLKNNTILSGVIRFSN